MARLPKSHAPGSTIRVTVDGKRRTVKVRRRKCHQCRKHSIVTWKDKKWGPTARCLNNCVSEVFARMLRF